MAKYQITPLVVLTIDLSQLNYITIAVKSLNTNKYPMLSTVSKYALQGDNYQIRKKVLMYVKDAVINHSVDTIIIEKVKFITDTSIIYPDFNILRDVKLNYGITISIEDAFMESVPYIIEVPTEEWTKSLFNSHTLYSPDIFKSHVNLENFTDQQRNIIDSYNFYKAICMCECAHHESLLKKYWIN